MEATDDDKTYRVRRFHFDSSNPQHHKVIATGLTLEEAQAHCQDENTHERDPETGNVIWFDGYDEE